MNTSTSTYEYTYISSEEFHHHAYLLPALLKLLATQSIPSTQPFKILDLGCGNGSLSQQLARCGYHLVGVEDSASGIQIAQQTIPECKFIYASIYDLPFADLENQFDVVLSIEVIEHLLYPRELLRAAKRCLKADGRLVLTTPYHGYWKNLALAILGKMDDHYTTLWDGGHIKFFSVTTLNQLLKQEGFTSIHFTFAGRFPYLWKSMLCSASPQK